METSFLRVRVPPNCGILCRGASGGNSKLLWVWEPDISERHPSFEDCDGQLPVNGREGEAGFQGWMSEVTKTLFAGGSSLGMILRSQQSHADQPLAKRR